MCSATGGGLPALPQKVLFVLGKGGTGRSALASALAVSAAREGLRVLVVQWSLHDAVGALFGCSPVGHKAKPCRSGVDTMNYVFEEALREYFVSHLGLSTLFDTVVRNRHVRRLLEAAPGLPELFFLGRVFWQAELAASQRGFAYDRIIVDAPASGHGVGLFALPRSVASMGIAGPLASESARVARFLEDESKVGVIVTALPEELPAHECLEILGRLGNARPQGALAVALNRSVSESLWNPKVETLFTRGLQAIQDTRCRAHLQGQGALLRQRREVGMWLSEELCERGIPLWEIPEFLGTQDGGTSLVDAIADVLPVRWEVP